MFTIGIDASNLLQGGGLTHLVELLRAASPGAHGVERVVVWSGRKTLDALDDRPWLQKINSPELEGGLVQRLFWQRFRLSRAARDAGCDVLFVPGGNLVGDFRPFVAMSRNMLPFDWRELRRYGWSETKFRLILLRFLQLRTFRSANGVIFLTRFAQEGVLRVSGFLDAHIAAIPHGLNRRFIMEPRAQKSIRSCSATAPFRLLYVSNVSLYKHQWHLVEAVASLRAQNGWPLRLELVGSATPAALKRLNASIAEHDPGGIWVRYRGAVPYSELHCVYAEADLGVFASSCENMPNILLEKMAAGLPLACSERGPMPEILGNIGVYFDPEEPEAIARALALLIAAPDLRARLAAASFRAAKAFTWERCAAQTFGFLSKVLRHRVQSE